MATVAWAPIAANGESTRLGSPYVRNDSHLILPSQDFTIRLTTISKSLLDDYGRIMKRGEYDNDYFCVLSHFGIGRNGEDKPSTSVNFVTREDSVRSNILIAWGGGHTFHQ